MRKPAILYLLFLLLSVPVMNGCMSEQNPIPSGRWYSMSGRPDIETTDSMTVTVYHRTADGTCPISYPLKRDFPSGGYYIQAAVRIMLSYDSECGVLYLSPGGEYIFME